VEPDALYLVMQFIEGEALDQRVERHVQTRTPMAVSEVLHIFRMVLQGVGAAHREGVIHRDLKPANILIRERDGVAKVTDFGIAKAEAEAMAGRGRTQGIIGSLLYMAPEQVSGRRDLDKRVDIYALGILLFELLMGRVPFDAPSEFEIMKLHMHSPLPHVSLVRKDVPPFIDELLQRACAKRREDRFASAEEFLAALDRGLAEQVPVNVPVASLQPAPLTHREPSPTGLSAAVAPAASVLPDSVAPPPRPAARGFLFGLIASIAGVTLLIAAALGLAWSFGWLGSHRASRPHRSVPSAPIPSATVSAPVADAAPPVTGLAELTGAWRSDSGRMYDAVLSGDVLEFRIRQAGDFAGQGYVDGEARFTLTERKGESRSFGVEDKLRPAPPLGKTYDPKARGTCQEVWSSLDNRPLRAQFDGTRLTVDLVKVVPALKMFEISGNKVVGCKGLRGAAASKIESTLLRP
jgi:serine/threonine-protein kinase